MTRMKSFQLILTRLAMVGASLFLVGAPVLAAGPSGDLSEPTAPAGDERASYTFLRTLEGTATVAPAGQGVGDELELNQPLLTGDQVRVGPRSRLELALSDHNRLHLDADTSVVLERIAFSGDSEERITVLRLEEGELLIEVVEEALGDELPRVITPNATVYFQEPGQYRIEAGIESGDESEPGGWTRVVTRSGFAEIVTDRGSSIVRADEAILAQGDRWVRLELGAADAPDALERWSSALADRALRAARSSRYVEPELAYAAAPLDDAGDWVEVESVRYWRPHVAVDWRPYWQGRWAWTPSGYTWVSYEPWGWVPYHYGRWCSLPGYGWAWRPGAVYSPAWVYWNWNSGWAGWVPIGYYTQFYNPWYRDSFRFGVYGWAGGGWGIYSDWNFAPVHCFRDRNFRGHLRTGNDRRHESRLPEPPRGLLTTDTRDFRPDRIDRTEDILHQIRTRNLPPAGGDLPDVTDFVGRKGKLPDDVVRAVIVRDGRTDAKERGRIRDIPDVSGVPGTRKIAEPPAWQQRDKSGDAKRIHLTGEKEPPVRATGRTRKDDVPPSSGLVTDKPRLASPRGLPPVKSRGSDGTVQSPRSPKAVAPQGPATKVYQPGPPSTSGRDQQRWKEKSAESAPVQRVVGSVRRPAPGAEPRTQPNAPTTSDKERASKGYPGYSTPGISTPQRQAPPSNPGSVAPGNRYQRRPDAPPSGYQKPAQRAPSSPPQTPRMSPSPPRPAPSRSSPQVQASPRSPSTVQRAQPTQRAQPPAKSPSTASGSKSTSRSGKSSPPPPPPPKKKEGGGSH